jgi:hypothetical protein
MTMSPVSRAALYGHLFRFITAWRLPGAIMCPHCSTPTDAVSLLQHSEE